MRAAFVALLACGCLAAPPEPSGAAADAGGLADGGDPGAAGDAAAAGRCVPGSRLDLAWVSEVAVDRDRLSPLALGGIALIINPGTDRIAIDGMSVTAEATGGVTAAITIGGGATSVAPGQASGALSTVAATRIFGVVSEEWTNLAAPDLRVVLSFAADWGPDDIRLLLDIGGYRFEPDLWVVPGEEVALATWARDARRLTAVCD